MYILLVCHTHSLTTVLSFNYVLCNRSSVCVYTSVYMLTVCVYKHLLTFKGLYCSLLLASVFVKNEVSLLLGYVKYVSNESPTVCGSAGDRVIWV